MITKPEVELESAFKLNDHGCWLLLRIVASVVLLCAGLVSPACSQSIAPPEDWPFGYHGFNLLMQESGVDLIDLETWSETPAAERCLISLQATELKLSRKITLAGAPVFMGCSSSRATRFRISGRLSDVASSGESDFYVTRDCPIVQPASGHPIFAGVERLICNRPGYIPESLVNSRFVGYEVVRYPPVVPLGRRHAFAVVSPQTKFACVADDLLFTNQMLFKGDNLLFAKNVIGWLTEDFKRKKVLFVVDSQVQSPVDPSDLAFDPNSQLPVPTREEVLDALQQLPIDKMAEFGNSVAANAEDESLLNDLAHKVTDSLRPKEVMRILLLAAFATCCLFGLVAYFWQKKLLRKTASTIASKRQRYASNRVASVAQSERQAAASMLLNAFCLDVADRRLSDWSAFPQGLRLDNEEESNRITHEMADAFRELKTKPKSHWNKKRLLELEVLTIQWREYFKDPS